MKITSRMMTSLDQYKWTSSLSILGYPLNVGCKSKVSHSRICTSAVEECMRKHARETLTSTVSGELTHATQYKWPLNVEQLSRLCARRSGHQTIQNAIAAHITASQRCHGEKCAQTQTHTQLDHTHACCLLIPLCLLMATLVTLLCCAVFSHAM